MHNHSFDAYECAKHGDDYGVKQRGGDQKNIVAPNGTPALRNPTAIGIV